MNDSLLTEVLHPTGYLEGKAHLILDSNRLQSQNKTNKGVSIQFQSKNKKKSTLLFLTPPTLSGLSAGVTRQNVRNWWRLPYSMMG